MSAYAPDCWELVKITSAEGQVTYKVIAGWYGGFAGSDSWKLSSGIMSVTDHGTHYEMPQFSGSVYHCGIGSRRLSGYVMSVLSSLQKQMEGLGAKLEILHDTDPTTLTITE